MRLKVYSILNFYLYQGKSISEKDVTVKVVKNEMGEENNWVFSYFPENLCNKRWQDGCSLYYLLDEKGEPCSFAWYRHGRQHYVGEINRTVVYPFDVNCIFDCITPQQFRGKGFYPTLIKCIGDEKSSRPSMIYATTTNIASNKGIVKVGFQLSHKAYKFLKFVKVSPINKEQIKIYVQG